jgi:hypothetical protein
LENIISSEHGFLALAALGQISLPGDHGLPHPSHIAGAHVPLLVDFHLRDDALPGVRGCFQALQFRVVIFLRLLVAVFALGNLLFPLGLPQSERLSGLAFLFLFLLVFILRFEESIPLALLLGLLCLSDSFYFF